jgi:hypothetical protein
MATLVFNVTAKWQVVQSGRIPLTPARRMCFAGACRHLPVDVGDLGADVALIATKAARSIRRDAIAFNTPQAIRCEARPPS